MSTTNEMVLEFYSDNSMSMKGFAAEYHTGIQTLTKPQCSTAFYAIESSQAHN